MASKPRPVVFFLIAALVAILFVPSQSIALSRTPLDPGQEPGWHIETIEEGLQFDWLRDRSIAVDAAGRPHIAYGLNHLYHAWLDGGQWRRETVDPSPGVGMFASLVIDAQGYEHISYNSDYTGDLKYAYRDAAGWQVETVDAEGSVGEFSSLALDSAGRPHIAYCAYDDQLGCYQLKYGSWTGSAWEIETVTNQAGVSSGYSASLVLDAQDRPHITEIEWAGQDRPGVLKYATRTGPGWQFETVDDQGDAAMYASLALNALGEPRVSYFARAAQALKYAVRCPGGWEKRTIDTGQNMDSAMVLDAAGSAYVLYSDVGEGIKLAHWTGTGWDIQVIDASEENGMYARYPGLALDSQGHPHVSYVARDRTIFYAGWTGAGWEQSVVDTESWAAGENAVVVDGTGALHVAYDSYPGGLKYAFRDSSGWAKEVVEPVLTLGYLAFALDPQGNPALAYHDHQGALLKYAYRGSGTWQVETLASCGDPVTPLSCQVDLRFDPAGRPAIVYATSDEPGVIYYLSKAGEDWVSETLGEGAYPSLAFDTAGNPAVAYVRVDTGELKYAERVGGQWGTQQVDAAIGSAPALALDQANQPLIAYDGPDALKLARRIGQSWQIATVDARTWWSWPKLALTAAGDPMLVYRLPYNLAAGGVWFAERTGQGWSSELVNASGTLVSWYDLAADGSGMAYITFGDQIANEFNLATRGVGLATAAGRHLTFLPALAR